MDGNSDMKRILVAEDVESNFMLLNAFIGKQYELKWAVNGLEAVKMFVECVPDLILMDIKMPFMDGYEATEEIRKLSDKVPIIALTAFAFEDDKRKALKSGCNAVLTKPISKNILLQTLDEYLK